MRITNHSKTAIWISEDGAENTTLAAQASLHTGARKVTLDIHYLPCKIEVAEEPEEVKSSGQ